MTEPTTPATPAVPGNPADEAERAIEQAAPVASRVEGDWVDELDESTDPPTRTGRTVNRWTGEAAESAPEFTGEPDATEAGKPENSGSQEPGAKPE